MNAMKLVLIGLRGSGKSTAGKIVAQRLDWPFFDTDGIVQEKTSLSIRELFEQRGEAAFRKLESVAVLECAAHSPSVIATGGGAVLDPRNVAALKCNAFVVHLSADPVVLWLRVSHDPSSFQKRPKLLENAESGIDELKKLMLARAAIYAAALRAGGQMGLGDLQPGIHHVDDEGA